MMIRKGGNTDTCSEPSEAAKKGTLTQQVHPKVDPELRKHKPWLNIREFMTLETEGKPIPNRVIDCLEAMLLHHMAATDNYKTFLASHRLMTDAIDADTEMNKSDLFHVIR